MNPPTCPAPATGWIPILLTPSRARKNAESAYTTDAGGPVKIPTALIAAAFSFTLLPAPPAEAIEWIRTSELKSYCQLFLTKPRSPSGTVCVSYIQGFLDGIKATEENRYEEIDEGIETYEEARYTFALAGVCLPRDAGINQILRVIARGIADASLEPRDPETSAINALRERYGCERTE